MLKLPEITYPLSIDTIGKMLVLGHELSVTCHTSGCGHGGRVNLVLLARKLGVDHPCLEGDLKPHFYCKPCRDAGRPDKNMSFTRQPRTDPVSPWPRQMSAYEKAKSGG